MVSSYISDGYTLKAIIHPVEGKHNGLTFEYRPMTYRERSRFHDNLGDLIKRENNDEVQDAIAQLVSDRMVSWNVNSPDNKTVEITSQSVEFIEADLYKDVYEVVAGLKTPDKAEDAEKNSDRG